MRAEAKLIKLRQKAAAQGVQVASIQQLVEKIYWRTAENLLAKESYWAAAGPASSHSLWRTAPVPFVPEWPSTARLQTTCDGTCPLARAMSSSLLGQYSGPVRLGHARHCLVASESESSSRRDAVARLHARRSRAGICRSIEIEPMMEVGRRQRQPVARGPPNLRGCSPPLLRGRRRRPGPAEREPPSTSTAAAGLSSKYSLGKSYPPSSSSSPATGRHCSPVPARGRWMRRRPTASQQWPEGAEDDELAFACAPGRAFLTTPEAPMSRAASAPQIPRPIF